MTTKHTPGPWWVDGRRYRCAVVGFNRNGDYALIRCADPAHEESYAALIAAAPELLAALRDCAEYLQLIPEPAAGGDDDSLRLFKAAAEAIAKAEGCA